MIPYLASRHARRNVPAMCTAYRLSRMYAEVARTFSARADALPNEPTPDVYPDRLAPVVRAKDGGREVVAMRWGFPPPPQGNAPVVNVRNVASPYWRGWLKPEWRCLVPFTSFSEWTDATPKQQRWFALGDDHPTGAFAGIFRPWTGTRGTKKEPVTGEHLLFSFLTCEPNAVVKPIHSKAMPVILATPDEQDTWLNAPREVALELQRPLPHGLMLLPA